MPDDQNPDANLATTPALVDGPGPAAAPHGSAEPSQDALRAALADGDAPPSTPITAAVAEAVAKEIRPLREQLDQVESKIRLHDIVGGIGYIVGISGVAFYFLAMRKTERNRTSEVKTQSVCSRA